MIYLPLSQIDIDWTWNARSVRRDKSGAIVSPDDIDGQGLTSSVDDLALSIGDFGQDTNPDADTHPSGAPLTLYRADNPETGYRQHTPVFVRALPPEEIAAAVQAAATAEARGEPAPPIPKPYKLIAGFSRCEALRMIAEARGELSRVCVKALVQHGSEAEARALNLSENTARATLPLCDLVYGVRLYIHELRAEGVGDFVERVNLVCGRGVRSKGYAAKLVRTALYLKPEVLDMWRTGTARPSLDSMVKIAELPPDDQEAAFFQLCADLGKPVAASKARNKATKLDQTAKIFVQKATEAGRLFAQAELEGSVTITDPAVFYDTVVKVLLRVTPRGETLDLEDDAQAVRDRQKHVRDAFLRSLKDS